MRKITTIVLAGGRSRRLGLDKALLCLDDETLLEATVKKVAVLGDEVIVAVRGPLPYRLPGVRLVTDVHPGCGPLGGIHAGLAVASNSCCSVVACDMPFLNLDLLRYLISLAEDADVVAPRWTDVDRCTPSTGRKPAWGRSRGRWPVASGASSRSTTRSACATWSRLRLPASTPRAFRSSTSTLSKIGSGHGRWPVLDRLRLLKLQCPGG